MKPFNVLTPQPFGGPSLTDVAFMSTSAHAGLDAFFAPVGAVWRDGKPRIRALVGSDEGTMHYADGTTSNVHNFRALTF